MFGAATLMHMARKGTEQEICKVVGFCRKYPRILNLGVSKSGGVYVKLCQNSTVSKILYIQCCGGVLPKFHNRCINVVVVGVI